MSETNIERNLISEEDLQKAAGGLKISSSTLKKGLIAAGILAVAGAAGGYYIYNNNTKDGGNNAEVLKEPLKIEDFVEVQPPVYKPLDKKEEN